MREDRQEIIQGYIENEMKNAYVDYAMSVIVGRALPDARDGLKPVHRRILYAMEDMGLTHRSAHKKSARIVGEVLGKYHPHGDSAVYDALVRMAQDFSLRYPLIDGQGNFGSIDGDSAAAMRYTEARMETITDETLQDLDKETVPFKENFDGALEEPEVLPSKLPNLLVNGSSGIAVGMATQIPPHNLNEICDAATALIDNPDMDIASLMDIVKGPDFPTGGIVSGLDGLHKAYKTGRGKVRVHSKVEEEDDKLVVTEIPYMLNKSKLIQKIADVVNQDRVEGVRDLRDESDRKGMRIVIELKRGANPELVKNQLFKHTSLATTFSIILIALVDDEPETLSLKELLQEHIEHRKNIVVKRTKYDLQQAEDRAHVLEGLITALDNIDDVIDLIREQDSRDEADEELQTTYELSERQSKAILNMRLQRLASMEQEKIKEEHAELQDDISEYNDILDSEERVENIVKDEYQQLKEDYGDERQTTISTDYSTLEVEDLIKEEDVVVTLTKKGYVKRTPVDTYKAQHRGGKGIIGAKTKEDDSLSKVFVANTHSYLLIFTDQGNVYWKKVYKLPEQSRTSKGTPIVNVIDMEEDETVRNIIPLQDFDQDAYLVTATRNGIVKKTALDAYSNPRRGGIIALGLQDNDELVDVAVTDGGDELLLATEQGMAVRFDETDVRSMGRTARGVIGIRLEDDDAVIGMVVCSEDDEILSVTQNGYGKRTPVSEYRLINRGGKGVINMKTTKGAVTSVNAVEDTDELILISKDGIIMRTRADEISSMGRNTQGVRVMRVDDEDEVASVEIYDESNEDDEQDDAD